MLQEVSIANIGSYPGEGKRLSPCKEVNFIFGTNGSGKTTISRVIADPDAFPDSRVTWLGGRALERLVYNADFAARNFRSQMPGIFTLGEESAETLGRIEQARKRREEAQEDVRKRRTVLSGEDGTGGKVAALKTLRAEFEEACWILKNRHDEHFKDVFEGLRNSKARFCDKVLSELDANTAALRALDDLKPRAATVFKRGLQPADPLGRLNFGPLRSLENAPILAKKVVGKDDVDVAALIKHLGNSDWVQEGRPYLEASSPRCPFCQQQLLTDLRSSLDDYFDESYTADLAHIQQLKSAYNTTANSVTQRLQGLLESEHPHCDLDRLAAELARLKQVITSNLTKLDAKAKEPSSVVELDAVAEIATAINELVDAADASIAEHNRLVSNLETERAQLTSEAWRCLLNEAQTTIGSYVSAKTDLERAIQGLTDGISAKNTEIARLTDEIEELERSITSVQPTVNEINGILTSFGFTGFELATAGESSNLYAVIRPDGTDATRTLSEGEKSFITFLYFYHLIRGSTSSSGMNENRVVVFDDPVSSLDSDVLFIVSTLIKQVMAEAIAGTGRIRQVFLLTHNIHFHKEVSFDPKRSSEMCRSHETFWVVRKRDNVTALELYGHNPIKTSYELLWSEVRNPNPSPLTIQNTLRRIVESYFTVLGNMDKDDIIDMFEGRDKQICGSLFSWVNDGSHAVHDDLYLSADQQVIDRHLAVFKAIFDRTKHIGHYNMMMGISAEAGSNIIATAEHSGEAAVAEA